MLRVALIQIAQRLPEPLSKSNQRVVRLWFGTQAHFLYHMLYTIIVTSVSSMPLAERGLLKASIGLTCVLATVTVR
jgi:hypothetical protein